jgi:hypothetical protein
MLLEKKNFMFLQLIDAAEAAIAAAAAAVVVTATGGDGNFKTKYYLLKKQLQQKESNKLCTNSLCKLRVDKLPICGRDEQMYGLIVLWEGGRGLGWGSGGNVGNFITKFILESKVKANVTDFSIIAVFSCC